MSPQTTAKPKECVRGSCADGNKEKSAKPQAKATRARKKVATKTAKVKATKKTKKART